MHPLYCLSFFTSRQTALESSISISTIPILVGRTAPCGRIIILQYRSWRNGFSKGRSRITAWVARFLLERSWRTVSVARCIANVSVCFIQFSKNKWRKRIAFISENSSRTGKRGLNKSCPAVTVYSFVGSSFISKSKIILISASLIRPFSSMSTTIYTLPYSS